MNEFEELLTGGHPNSLGNTLQVVEAVLADKKKLKQLYECYFSEDEVVRLRVSNGMKRVCIEHPEWVYEHLDGLLNEISKIDQASTQWTLALLFQMLEERMTPQQKAAATEIMKHNLAHHKDWIVLNNTSMVLAEWAKTDDDLAKWVKPQLKKLLKDPHKSVARRAEKLLSALD